MLKFHVVIDGNVFYFRRQYFTGLFNMETGHIHVAQQLVIQTTDYEAMCLNALGAVPQTVLHNIQPT